MIAPLVLSLLTSIGQLILLALLAPFLTDLDRGASAVLGGEKAPPPGWRWRQIRAGWRQGGPLPPVAWLGFCLTLPVLSGLPLARANTLFGFLSEPALCGVMLIAAAAPCWIHALTGMPTRALTRTLHDGLARRGRTLLLLVPLLTLSGTLIAVGLPGAGTLTGLLQQRQLQPAPALMGGLVFIAAALILSLDGLFLDDRWHEVLIARTTGRHRSVLRIHHDLLRCGWTLMIADLLWPGSIAVGDTSTRHDLLLWSLVAPVKLAVVTGFVALARLLRPLPPTRLALVLAGGAILLTLAGRIGV
ncbi:hypothetical protein [Swaminathania salitolerans]|uniref:Formate hydrogenlyase subunit 4 n=1 Tax=Swaminathania salitolerans TaxID=182838 RepID=A0A511BSP5_9PROT|nr:hypothetical protein [Swaminathania salitolerans]GBQ09476.1 hypothetical protein AA21291_0085 [Swaminathania salitolerans LMG 21291]GEL00958.1 hypothetical protein SSA02_01210 [Swaminathania salitolerans]